MTLETIRQALVEFELIGNTEEAKSWLRRWTGKETFPASETGFYRLAVKLVNQWIKECLCVSDSVAK